MIRLKEDRQYDYREFLRKYAVWGETLSLDTDSFDYLPYDYGRRMYENLLLLELWNIRKCGDYGNLSLLLIRPDPVQEKWCGSFSRRPGKSFGNGKIFLNT